MSVQDYSPVPGSNTTISGINVGEGCAPANINNAIRQVMADIADGVVQYYAQDKTPAQRSIARANLGLADLGLDALSSVQIDNINAKNIRSGIWGVGETTAGVFPAFDSGTSKGGILAMAWRNSAQGLQTYHRYQAAGEGGGETYQRWIISDTWGPWVKLVAGINAAAMRAQIGITVGTGGLNRLNESVNHVDASWVAGASDLPGLASPKQIADAIAALVPPSLGVGQTWTNVLASREANTVYQNTTGRTIQLRIQVDGTSGQTFKVSENGTSWKNIATYQGTMHLEALIPPDVYYQTGNGKPYLWWELR